MLFLIRLYRNNFYAKIHGETTLYAEWLNPHNFNRYIYCNNNPIRYIDPLGEDPRIKVSKLVGKKILKALKKGKCILVQTIKNKKDLKSVKILSKDAAKLVWKKKKKDVYVGNKFMKKLIKQKGADGIIEVHEGFVHGHDSARKLGHVFTNKTKGNADGFLLGIPSFIKYFSGTKSETIYQKIERIGSDIIDFFFEPNEAY